MFAGVTSLPRRFDVKGTPGLREVDAIVLACIMYDMESMERGKEAVAFENDRQPKREHYIAQRAACAYDNVKKLLSRIARRFSLGAAHMSAIIDSSTVRK